MRPFRSAAVVAIAVLVALGTGVGTATAQPTTDRISSAPALPTLPSVPSAPCASAGPTPLLAAIYPATDGETPWS